ncbi:hypothetical protein [Thermophilibacter sp.]
MNSVKAGLYRPIDFEGTERGSEEAKDIAIKAIDKCANLCLLCALAVDDCETEEEERAVKDAALTIMFEAYSMVSYAVRYAFRTWESMQN